MKKALTHLEYFGVGLLAIIIFIAFASGVYMLVTYWFKPAAIVIIWGIISLCIYSFGKAIYKEVTED